MGERSAGERSVNGTKLKLVGAGSSGILMQNRVTMDSDDIMYIYLKNWEERI